MTTTKRYTAAYWIVTIIFAVHMGFTAYAQLTFPEVKGAFVHLGFPSYFRVELSWAKFAGLIVLLVPGISERLKEWAYAGFAIVVVSALIAHWSVGDPPRAWIWAAGAGVLLALSYFFRLYGGSVSSLDVALPVARRAVV
jgi:hypothetical protein